MSMESNYILNVFFPHSAPGGENPSVTPRDCMEKSCFLKPSNTSIYIDMKTGRAVRDICAMVNELLATLHAMHFLCNKEDVLLYSAGKGNRFILQISFHRKMLGWSKCFFLRTA